MSWDVDLQKDYPCPCGNGTFTRTDISDDWNRSGVEYSMNCAVCAQNYVLSDNRSRWLLRTNHDAWRAARRVSMQAGSDFADAVQQNYTPNINSFFRAPLTRARERMSQAGYHVPAIGSFRTSIRSQIQRVLSDPARAINALQIDDPNIDTLVENCAQSRTQEDAMEAQMMASAIRAQ